LNNINHIQKTSYGKFDTNKKTKGVPDLIIPMNNGVTLWIEFKTGVNDLRLDQDIWRIYLLTNKHKYYIVREIDEFYRLINNGVK
jgi:hypothetical protein